MLRAAGVICGLGDFVAQQFVERRGLGGHYWRRTGSMAAIGFCFTVCHMTISRQLHTAANVCVCVCVGSCIEGMVQHIGQAVW